MAWTPYYSEGWQSGEAGGTPITPEALNHMDDGIAGAVEKTGDEMTGNLTLPHINVQSGGRYSNIHFRDSNDVPRGMMWGDGDTGRIFFRSINPNVASGDVGSYYTEYYLYQSSLTNSSVSYKIYTERDTIPVDHGGTGATSIHDAVENIGISFEFNTTVTLATMYPKLSKVPVPGSALLWLNPTASKLLSGNAIDKYCTCVASTTGSGSWRFMAFNGSGDIFVWDISGWTSASATPTIGAIRRVAVQRTQDVTETTDSNGNISLGLAAASYHVLSAKSPSRIVTPWVSNDDNNWHARVTGVNGNATASTSVTVTVIYTLA